MTSADYVIAPYQSEWRQQVAELMVYLWGADVEANLAYLRWKHESNPHAEQPLAIVAVHGGRVVGFRGYMALPFRIAGANDDLIVLCPGDTCVHPEHRRSGLSVRMGRGAMKYCADRYPLFMNWSCTKSSLPGYRKMGFQALAERTYLNKATPLGTLRYLLASRRARPASPSRIRFGRSGKLHVAAEPRVAEMAALARTEEVAPGRLALHRDEEFLTWRLANPMGKYVFYYLLRDDDLAGYVAVARSPGDRRHYLLDWAGAEPGVLGEIMEGMISLGHFDVLSVYAFCLSFAERRVLERLGFSVTGPIALLERLKQGRLPLLLRPVKETFGGDDFWLQAVDTRRVENWSLKPMGSDAG